ncbi:hypothetical protein [Streptomyces panaciradicis]|uniref:hypothetical protein n=1 Tax=Streptomyces panaciradicis TaxID=1470261 RepID=UPI00201D2689|nr:hypothetical protein [Streptomyces panaciradicis]MCL6670206.1 hypothetical protein [Streptomyces panaciradicis]
MREISGALGVKRPLRDLGVDRAMPASIAVGAVVTKNAPRLPSESEVLELLTLTY